MKHKLVFCSLVVSLAFCKVSIAQSSSIGAANVTSNKPLIIEGNQFPMSASEYSAKQKLAQQKKAAEVPAVNQGINAPVLVAISAEDLKNLRKEEKQQAATTAPVSSAKSAATPVKSTQTQVAKPATSKQGSGN